MLSSEPTLPSTDSIQRKRIAWKAAAPRRYWMYFHCRTTLVDNFRTLFPSELKFEGNRAIVFELSDSVPREPLAVCIAMALT